MELASPAIMDLKTIGKETEPLYNVVVAKLLAKVPITQNSCDLEFRTLSMTWIP